MSWKLVVGVTLLLLQDSQSAKILHTVDGHYDESWRAQNLTSLSALAELTAQSAVLVAYLDDTAGKDSCAFGTRDAPGKNVRGFDPILLRHAQRNVASRFLATALIYRSTLAADPKGAWPPLPINQLEPRPEGVCTIVVMKARTQPPRSKDSWRLLEQQKLLLYVRGPQQMGLTRDALGPVNRLLTEGSRAPEITFKHAMSPFEDTDNQQIKISWVNADEKDVKEAQVGKVLPSKSLTISSFVGHTFTLRRLHDDTLVGFVHVSRAGEIFTAENDMLHKCTSNLREQAHDPHLKANLNEYRRANLNEFKLNANMKALAITEDRALLAEAVQDIVMEKRLALSDVQVFFTPAITEAGFTKVKMPADLFQKVRNWYLRNHDRVKRVESDGGPLYNQRVIPTWHTPLPGDLKQTVFDEMKSMMSAWANGMALKGTSCYGVRTYQRDSYLHLHVDTVNTHVISGIINVNQSVGSAWPLEILDHDGKLHSVTMEPGDLVFYESARLLHGRPHPLDGDSYANVFVHYMPERAWDVRI